MNQTDIDQLTRLLSKPTNIVITSHYNPDGDAVGSAMAFYHILIALNHQVSVVFPNSFPSFLNWITNSDKALFFDHNQVDVEHRIESANVIFCLDYNALNRVGDMEAFIKNAKATKILIDHHPNPDFAAFDFSFHNTKASSTAELIYNFLGLCNLKNLISKPVAECIYTGIITDTGSLSFNCNRAETYQILSDLVEKGIDPELLHRLIYDNFSEYRMRLLGYAIYQKMIMIPDCNSAIIPLTMNELDQFRYQQGDTEGVVNFPLSVKTINLSILLTQRKDRIRLSFRSKGSFPANEIAAKYFDGGGHRNAAGGDSFVSLDETIDKIREILPLYRNQLDFVLQ